MTRLKGLRALRVWCDAPKQHLQHYFHCFLNFSHFKGKSRTFETQCLLIMIVICHFRAGHQLPLCNVRWIE